MYARGDYYAGDYYAGDNIFSKAFKGLTSIAKMTPIGRAVSTAIDIVGAARRGPQIQAVGANPAGQAQISGGAQFERTTVGPGGLLYSHTSGSLAVDTGVPASMGGGAPGTALQCVPGMHVRRTHPNKSTYVTRGGGTSRWPQQIMVHPKGTECVPSRRMNVANPRALRRALRRVAGFGKLAKRSRRAVSIAASSLGVRSRGARKVRR